MIIDTHAHYNLEPFYPNWQSFWKEAQAAGVQKSIVIGTNVYTSKIAVEIASHESHLFAAVGMHPTEEEPAPTQDFWDNVLSNKKVVAIGECGLDYARIDPISQAQEREKQRQHDLLTLHVDQAKMHNLPVIVHCRDAHADLLDTLHYDKVVLHCMSGSLDYLKEALKRGWYISFAGNVGYKNAATLRELALATPIDRILVETDAPFLPPQSKRGKTNLPQYITETVDVLAELFKLSSAEFQTQTSANAETIFPKLRG